MSMDAILIIGTVFSLFLLVIGLTSFANTMATNIYARQKGFATLESIGMKKKQIFGRCPSRAVPTRVFLCCF